MGLLYRVLLPRSVFLLFLFPLPCFVFSFVSLSSISFAFICLAPPVVFLCQVLRASIRHVAFLMRLAVSAPHVTSSFADWESPSSCGCQSGSRRGAALFGGVFRWRVLHFECLSGA